MNWGFRTPSSVSRRESLQVATTVPARQRRRPMWLIATFFAAAALAQATPALGANVSIGNAPSVLEGGTGTTTSAVFDVTLTAPADAQTYTVDFATQGTFLGATGGLDYDSVTPPCIPTCRLTFDVPSGNAGSSLSQTISITVNGDTADEADEDFQVVLSNPQTSDPGGLSIISTTATTTITDDDTQLTLTGAATVLEGTGAGTTSVTYTVTALHPPAAAVAATYTIGHVDTAAGDFTNTIANPLSGSINIGAGGTTDSFTIDINRDNIDELNETFTATITSPTGGPNETFTLAGTPPTTITDDDNPPVVSIGAVTVAEGNLVGSTTIANFPVTLDTASGLPVTVTLTTGGVADTATSAGTTPDYTGIAGTPVTIPPGQVSVDVPVLVNQDDIYEDGDPLTPNPTVEAETFTATLALPSGSNATAGTLVATGAITNDDAFPTISIVGASAGELDAGATSIATFGLTLSNPSAFPISVNATTTDGPAPIATSLADYVPVNQLVSIPALATTAPLNITINGDLLDEFDEQFTVTLSAPSNATLGVVSTAIGTIVDNDALPTISFQNPSTETILEGNTGTTTKNIVIQLSVRSGRDVTVNWDTPALAELAPNATLSVDFAPVSPGPVTFVPGVTTMTIQVNVIGDTNASEGSESIGVRLSPPVNALPLVEQVKQLLILEDDTPNQPPFPNIDVLTVARNASGTINVRANDTDPNGDAMFVPDNANGAHGIATCRSTGVCIYTPTPGYSGPDSFTYTLSDGQATVTGTVNVTVVNAAPIANPDALVTAQGAPGAVNVLANDTDPDGGTLSVASAANGAHGTVACGAGTCNYVPAGGFIGADQFTYTLKDNDGATAVGTVSVTVAKGKPLTITASANGAKSRKGAKNGYTITIRNPNPGPVTLTSVSVCIPKGFSYTAGSVAGPLKKIPAKGACGAGKAKLTWAKKVSVPARRVVTLRFKVNVGGALTTAKVTVTAKAADGFAVIPLTKPAAPIKVTALLSHDAK